MDTKINYAFLFYILLFFLTKSFNTGLAAGLNTLFRYFLDYFVYFWVYYFVAGNLKRHRYIDRAIFFAGILSISYGLLQIAGFDFFHRLKDVTRISGFHKNSYTYAGQLVIFLFFLFSKLDIKKLNIWRLSSIFLCMICIFSTTERAVIIGVIISLIFYFFYTVKKESIFIVFSVLFVPIGLVLFFNKTFTKKFKNLLSPSAKWRNNTRFKLWNIAIGLWKKNLWFGVGKFPAVLHPGSHQTAHFLTHAHNVYLQILVTNGILGFLSFIGLFASVIKKAVLTLRTNPLSIYLLLVILVFMIEGFFEYFWGDSEVRYLFLFFLGYVFSKPMTLKAEKL